jgi:hypothetical protein
MQKGRGNGEVKRKFHFYGLTQPVRKGIKVNDSHMDNQQQVRGIQEEEDKIKLKKDDWKKTNG